MDKKGFTLVELLAVIAILAILVIIAMPNVLEMFNKAKVDAFETEVKTHVKAVSNQFITTGKLVYSNVVDGAAKLPMDGEELDYYIELDSQGNIKELNVTNGDYKIEATGSSQNPIKVEQIGETIKSETAESGTNFEMSSSGVIIGGTDEPRVKTLAGTTWQFNDSISDYSFLDVFNFEEQTGWDEFPSNCILSNSKTSYEIRGFTRSIYDGIDSFGNVHGWGNHVLAYSPKSTGNFVSGWYLVTPEGEEKIIYEIITTIDELAPYITLTDAPTIKFSSTSNSALENTRLINWMYKNAVMQ